MFRKNPIFVYTSIVLMLFKSIYLADDGRVKTYFSSISAAIVVVYFGMIIENLRFMYSKAYLPSSKHFEFHDFTDILPIAVIRLYMIIVPFSVWRKGKTIQQHVNNWFECQVQNQKNNLK